ncbi:MAG: NAD(P)-dependent oxidoreductase [Gammaproteobacteria bacterium]|jgi:3-hydroxyisobutyrate dehydrogenase|nr:NAD(P)-dependent oxidoreductase [Gammaproteobacteria bacterium]NCW73999.1 NAD(P)-dependent oxidoreductase [Gammaproteobacteria bacterium]
MKNCLVKTMTRETIGLIGAGRMGLAQIKHLIKAGYAVSCCEQADTQQTKALALGAVLRESPAAVFAEASIVYIAVGFDPEVINICRGEHGLLSTDRSDGIVVVNSTCDPELMIELGDEFAAKGIEFLDIPIARGGWAADNGTLLAMVGGQQATLDKVRPSLSTFCSDIKLMGPIGRGQVTKAINNLLLWLNGVGLLESAQIAESYDMDLEYLRDVLLLSSGRSAAMEDWSKMTFTWAAKDMQIVEDVMQRYGLDLELLQVLARRAQTAKVERETRNANGKDWINGGK